MENKYGTSNNTKKSLEESGKISDVKLLIKKGKWESAVRMVEKESGLSSEDAKKVAIEIREEWLNEHDSKEIEMPKKKNSVVSKIIVAIFIIALLGGGGYFAYNQFVKIPKEYSMNTSDNVNGSELVCTVGDTSDNSPEGESYHNNLKKLYDVMEETDATYFSYDYDSKELYKFSKEEFNKKLDEYQSGLTADKVSAMFGPEVKGLLNENYKTISKDKCIKNFPDGVVPDYVFDGESPNKYFESRKLDLSCDEINGKKMVMISGSGDWLDLGIMYDAEVTTNSCTKKSFFPKEGETENMSIMSVGLHDTVGLHQFVDIIF